MGILSRIKAAAGSVVSVDDDLDFQSSQRAKNLAAPESPNDAFRDADYTPENDVHDRYTDGEAINAVESQTSIDVSISGDADSVDNIQGGDIAQKGTGGVEVPSYQDKADVPGSITEGELVYIRSDRSLYVEDGT